MRLPFKITNFEPGKSGKWHKDKLFVRIGKESRTFTEETWEDGGLQWVEEQLKGGSK